MATSYIRRGSNTFVRSHTLRKLAVFNGVAVRDIGLFDTTGTPPEYKDPFVSRIRSRVDSGDGIVIVSCRREVSSVAAAHRTRSERSVTTYNAERYESAVETITLDEITNIIDIKHAIVGEVVDLANPPHGAAMLPPAELPDCDVLVLDCEGVEIGILKSIDQHPRVLIVETHTFLDSHEEDVRATPDDMDYEAVDRGVEVKEMGVYVLTAVGRL